MHPYRRYWVNLSANASRGWQISGDKNSVWSLLKCMDDSVLALLKCMDGYILTYLKCIDGSVLAFLKCMDGSVWSHLRFPTQSVATLFLQSAEFRGTMAIMLGITSLLHRLQAQTLPDEAQPIGKIHPFSKIAITFKPVMRFGCLSGFRISWKIVT